MSIKGFAKGFANFIEGTVDAIVDSKAIPNAVGKATNIAGHGLEAAGKIGMKGAAGGLAGVAEGVDFWRRHRDDIKKGAMKVGQGVTREAGTLLHAGAVAGEGAVDLLKKSKLVERTNFGDSLIGLKATKRGVAVAAGVSLIGGLGRVPKETFTGREGSNDGQLYRPTPQMMNPYNIAQEMAYSQSGRSFADNAGATGDLALALSNMR